MKLRDFLIGTALMTVALVNAKAAPPPIPLENIDPDLREETSSIIASKSVPAVPSQLVSEDRVFGAAYYDILKILSTSNPCSDFFGERSGTVEIFNRLVGHVRKGHFAASVAMKMSGDTTNITNNRTKRTYRMFDKVSLNTNGPFYRKRMSDSEPSIPRIGNFAPNSKEVRVLILLHELGHVIKGPNGSWLLPNDGHDEGLSLQNSHKIADVCGEQIRNMGRPDVTNNLAIQNRADQSDEARPGDSLPQKDN